MQQRHLVIMLSAATLSLVGHHVQAQQAAATATPAPLTRAQVKMEREDFIKSHKWDADKETWVLKPEFEPPGQMKGRAEVRKERDEFLRNNRWDTATETWVPLVQPRVVSQLSREQMRKETREFLRTHEWDTVTEAWILKRKRR